MKTRVHVQDFLPVRKSPCLQASDTCWHDLDNLRMCVIFFQMDRNVNIKFGGAIRSTIYSQVFSNDVLVSNVSQGIAQDI